MDIYKKINEAYKRSVVEANGFIVKSDNKKEYLAQFDFKGKKQLKWTKDKKGAMVFPDQGSAQRALEMTIGKNHGSIQKVNEATNTKTIKEEKEPKKSKSYSYQEIVRALDKSKLDDKSKEKFMRALFY